MYTPLPFDTGGPVHGPPRLQREKEKRGGEEESPKIGCFHNQVSERISKKLLSVCHENAQSKHPHTTQMYNWSLNDIMGVFYLPDTGVFTR